MHPRKSAAWQHQLDDRILEYLHREGWGSPDLMAAAPEFDASEGRIGERCQMLVFAGMVAPLHADMYELTNWGQLYLDGDLDAGHQPVSTVDRVLRG